jgi:hypothetical protein
MVIAECMAIERHLAHVSMYFWAFHSWNFSHDWLKVPEAKRAGRNVELTLLLHGFGIF